MALRMLEGFNTYVTAADMLSKWTSSGSVNSFLTGRRAGSKCAGLYNPGGATAAIAKTLDAQSAWIWGGAFMCATAAAVVSFKTSAGEQISLRVDASLQLYVSRNGTTLWSSGSDPTYRLTASTWIYLEFKSDFSTTTGSWSLRVNGSDSTIVGQTEVNTAAQGDTTADRIAVGGGGTGTVQQTTDMYLCDTTTAFCNDMLGDCRVDPLLPSSDGAVSDFAKSTGSTSYNLVDDLNNGDTDYISSATPGAVTTVNVADMPYTPTTVFGVNVTSYAKKDDTGARGVKNIIRSGGVNYLGAERALTTAYAAQSELWNVNPDTGALFTLAEMNALEIGVTVAS